MPPALAGKILFLFEFTKPKSKQIKTAQVLFNCQRLVKWELSLQINFAPRGWLRQNVRAREIKNILEIGGILPGTGVPPLFCPCSGLLESALEVTWLSWWGHAEILLSLCGWESTSSTFWFQQVWGLSACGQYTVNFFRLLGVSVSAKQLKQQGLGYYL